MESLWVECVVDDDYEINTSFPYQIRKKCNKMIVSESINKNGYVRCKLNGKTYQKHRILALQFIPNDSPQTKQIVDHINRIRTDNRINNIRWVTASENSENKSSDKNVKYEYVDDLPNDFVELIFYKGIEFENYYYSPTEDKFYYDNGLKYRVLHVNDGKGYKRIRAHDINGKSITVYIDRWKRDEGLI